MTTTGIMQPTYLPWIGYFKMIQSCDNFIFLDSVQFDKRSWQQRNYIRGNSDKILLSIPVLSKGRFHQKINQVSIDAKDQEGFLDYISKPINSKGQSQADLDRGKEDLEAKLLFDFFRYKGYDFETFINNRVGSKRVESLREQLLRSAKIKEEDFKQIGVDEPNKFCQLQNLHIFLATQYKQEKNN